MKVNKTVTTQYEVTLPLPITPITLTRAILKLEVEGVRMEATDIKILDDHRFLLSSNKRTYHDESVLYRMEK